MAMASDSLPYIDLEFNDPAIKHAVDVLVQEELRAVPPPSAMTVDLPPPSPLQGLDFAQYTLSQGEDRSTSHAASASLHMLYSLQLDRVQQLTLLQQHGTLAWLAHLQQLEGYVSHLDQRIEQAKQFTLDLNRQRKTEQLEAKANLDFVQHQIDTTKQSNLSTLLAIRSLREQLENRGT